jgi:hypothetical protein
MVELKRAGMDLLRTIPTVEETLFVRTFFALPLPMVPRHVACLGRVVLHHRGLLHVRDIESIILYCRPHVVRIGKRSRAVLKARCEIVLGPARRPVKTKMRGFTGIRYGRLVRGRWRARA